MAVGSEELRWEEGKATKNGEIRVVRFRRCEMSASYSPPQAVVFDAALLNQTPIEVALREACLSLSLSAPVATSSLPALESFEIESVHSPESHAQKPSVFSRPTKDTYIHSVKHEGYLAMTAPVLLHHSERSRAGMPRHRRQISADCLVLSSVRHDACRSCS